MRSADIKNLAIAMEALSRVAGTNAELASIRIYDLLTDAIKEEETRTTIPKPQHDTNDEIPF